MTDDERRAVQERFQRELEESMAKAPVIGGCFVGHGDPAAEMVMRRALEHGVPVTHVVTRGDEIVVLYDERRPRGQG